MSTKEKSTFKLMDLPLYDYKTGLACPECYVPISRGRIDGRCDDCQKDKKVLPVNWKRPPKKKKEETEEDEY